MPAKRTTKRTTPRKPKPQEPLRLELACGQRKDEGWIGVDSVPTPAVDVVHDLETYPWPFDAASVDEVRISHFIEHLVDPFAFFDELWRVLKPGGQAGIVAPYYTSMRATQDPTHRQYISEAWFYYFNREWRTANGLDHYPVSCDFDFSWGYNVNPAWQMRSEDSLRFAILHYSNVVDDIVVTMTKRA